MIQYRRVFLFFVAGLMLTAGNLRAEDKKVETKAAVKTDSPTVSAMKAAIALAEAGKIDEAVKAYEAMGVLKSKKMEAWRLNNEALAYLMDEKTDRADKAVPLLEKATATDETNYRAWNSLGSAYERTNQLDKAKEAYQKSIDAAKAANETSSKAEGNLEALTARMDRAAAKEAKKAGKAKPDASAKSDKKAPNEGDKK